MNLEEYIVSTVHLYGMIHAERVLHIYKKHHPNKPLPHFGKINFKRLEKDFVYYEKGFFIHQAIWVDDDMSRHLLKTNGKPYWMPCEAELKLYLDPDYFPKNDQYQDLYMYTLNSLVPVEEDVEEILHEVVISIQVGSPLGAVVNAYLRRKLEIDEKELKRLTDKIMLLYNHTKMWENNGFSPIELRQWHDRAKHTGRNDPCPCGSGKKYKNCCLGKDHIDDDLGQLTYENVFSSEADA